jgi:hypothetical protein
MKATGRHINSSTRARRRAANGNERCARRATATSATEGGRRPWVGQSWAKRPRAGPTLVENKRKTKRAAQGLGLKSRMGCRNSSELNQSFEFKNQRV